jgi:hypothetical protein
MTHPSSDLVNQIRQSILAVKKPPLRQGEVHCFPLDLAEEAASRLETLESALRASPCTCQSYGRASIPPQPDDYTTRQWCGRCLSLGYDKNPEPKPVFTPGLITLRMP